MMRVKLTIHDHKVTKRTGWLIQNLKGTVKNASHKKLARWYWTQITMRMKKLPATQVTLMMCLLVDKKIKARFPREQEVVSKTINYLVRKTARYLWLIRSPLHQKQMNTTLN